MIETSYQILIPFFCSMALLTDTHNRNMDEVICSLQRHQPDLILIAGDFVYGKAERPGLLIEQSINTLHLLKECSRITQTYVSLGNHEKILSLADNEMIQSTGCVLLDNRWIEHQIGENLLLIGGLTSARCIEYRAYRNSLQTTELYPPSPSEKTTHPIPEISWLNEYEKASGYHVLLCHHPEYYFSYLKKMKIELICSGHAHGGQIRLFGHGLYSPGQGIFPKFTSGIHDSRLVISRGLCNTTIIPRIHNPTEIVYLETMR